MKWRKVHLGELLTVIRNGIDAEQFDNPIEGEMWPISRIETISDGTVDFSRVKYALVNSQQKEKYALQSGDILFSHINSPEQIAKTAIFLSKIPLIHGINLLLLRSNPELCNPEYLNYYLKSNKVRALFKARCKKAVNQASLNQGDITELEVPLPPLPEQRRIAAILAKADRLRRLRRYARQLGDTYLQSVFLEMFGEPERNPKRWPLVSGGDVFEKIGYGVGTPPPFSNNGLIFLRAMNIKPTGINLDNVVYFSPQHAKLVSRSKVRAGDVVVVRRGANTGDTALIPIELDGSHVGYDLILRPNNKRILGTYFVRLMNTDFFRNHIYQIRERAAQQGLNAHQIAELVIPLPDLELQIKFARIVNKLERLRTQQLESERQAENLFQSLLDQVFRDKR